MSAKAAAGAGVWKVLAGVFGGVGAAATATAVAVPVVMYNNSKQPETQKTYTVKFNTNSGSAVPQQKVVEGEKVIKPEAPTKQGFVFLQWTTDKDGLKPFDFNTAIKKNMTLYAQYKAEAAHQSWTVDFDLNGGELISGSLSTEKADGVKLKDINTPSFSAPSGKKFKCWSVDGVEVDGNYIISSNIILKAVYETKPTGQITHTLYFVVDGDEKIASGSSILTIADGTTWAQVKNMANFPVLTKEGFTIGEYYIPKGPSSTALKDTDTFDGETDSVFMINTNWEKNATTHKVTFKLTDKLKFVSGKASESMDIEDQTPFNSVARPAVIGTTDASGNKYVPNGKWYTDSTWANEYTNNITADVTVWAGYEYIPAAPTPSYTYTVNFVNPYGFVEGTTTEWSKTVATETTYTWANVKSSAPENTTLYDPDGKQYVKSTSNYTFAGWSITDDTTVIPEGTTTVVAKFVPKEYDYYTVNFTSTEQCAWTGTQSYTAKFAKGTSPGSLSVSSVIGNSVDNIPVVKKDGYVFDYWYILLPSGELSQYGVTGSAVLSTTLSSERLTNNILTFVPHFNVDTNVKTIRFFTTSDYGTLEGSTVIQTTDASKALSTYIDTSKVVEGKLKPTPSQGYEYLGLIDLVSRDVIEDPTKYTLTGKGDQYIYVQFGKSFANDSWANIKAYADQGSDYLKWAYCKNDMIGLTKNVEINGKNHVMRVIGQNHDAITGNTAKAPLTFGSDNVLSNSAGYNYTTIWDDKATYSDYTNSVFRKNLNRLGEGTFGWSGQPSETRSLFEMLPTDLQSLIINVDKETYVRSDGSWGAKIYSDKIFPLTHAELRDGFPSEETTQVEGTTYEYYKEYPTTDRKIKRDLNGTAREYWLATPSTNDQQYAWSMGTNGSKISSWMTTWAYSVCFCFCI